LHAEAAAPLDPLELPLPLPLPALLRPLPLLLLLLPPAVSPVLPPLPPVPPPLLPPHPCAPLLALPPHAPNRLKAARDAATVSNAVLIGLSFPRPRIGSSAQRDKSERRADRGAAATAVDKLRDRGAPRALVADSMRRCAARCTRLVRPLRKLRDD
jgi:hypothetical protein